MRPAVAGLVALVIGTVVTVALLGSFGDLELTREQRSLTYTNLDHLEFDRALAGVVQGDGQAFAALAQDPTLARPEVFRPGPGEAAYRAQRPLLGWLGWVASGGRPEVVPEVLYVLTVLSYAALAVAAVRLAGPGAGPAVLLVLVLPGSLVLLDWTGPELLGTAAALAALEAWRRERPAAAAGLLAVAALSRETLLLVAAVCALDALLRRRARPFAWGLAPLGVYLAWIGVVRWRVDAWPWDAGEGRLAAPFTGMVAASGGWDAVEWTIVVAGAAAVGVALALRRDLVAYVALAHLAFATVMGELVWGRQEDFGRILLPMHASTVVAIVSAVASRRAGAAGGGSSPPPRTRGPGPGTPAAVPAPPSA